ncbi:MAG: PQQ-dependent sugar dehydrogenase, partial [Nitrososphaeraceae archaeon]
LITDPLAGPAQASMSSPTILLDLPATPTPSHNGGKVRIGPHDDVNVVIGDLNGREGKAQNFENGTDLDGSGGILTVSQDGDTARNGVLGTTHPADKYLGYGFRNSFGIDYDPLTGIFWIAENGDTSDDEINLVESGFNSGWKQLMGMAPVGFNSSKLTDFDGKGNYSDPKFVWTNSVGLTAIEFLNSSRLDVEYQNDAFVGDYNNGRIHDFTLNAERDGFVLTGVLEDKVANTDYENQDVIFGEGFDRVTDIREGPDGYLYVLSFEKGEIYRIMPKNPLAFVFTDHLQQMHMLYVAAVVLDVSTTLPVLLLSYAINSGFDSLTCNGEYI